jgi:predicted secreted protein
LKHPRLFAFALALCLIAGFSSSRSSGTETVIVNKAFNGREIKVRVNGLIRVDLEELGAAGYDWANKDLDQEHFEIVSVETKGAPPTSDVTGAPVIKTWLFRATKKGASELKFLYYRPWEGEKNAADSFILKVRIL